MKTILRSLVLVVIVASTTYGARAQGHCPAQSELEVVRIELQHEKLIASKDPHLQRRALDNIVSLSKWCNGTVTFARLLPDLIRMYNRAESVDQPIVLDAIYAVNEAVAMENLQAILKRTTRRSASGDLWAKIVERHQADVARL